MDNNNCTCDTLKQFYYLLDCNKAFTTSHQTLNTSTCLTVVNIYATQCSYDTHRIIIKNDDTIKKDNTLTK